MEESIDKVRNKLVKLFEDYDGIENVSAVRISKSVRIIIDTDKYEIIKYFEVKK